MPRPPSSLNIEVISAGAGSGKTFTLTGRMVALLETGVRPSAIMATTFTKKAAAELQERVRVRLLEAGRTEAANELGSALIGTVHSIGTRLLQRFAFEAGVSPLVEIIADGDEQRLFNESLAQVLTEARIETMNRLADRLGLTKKNQGEPYDWRREIRNLTDVARANNFSAEVLKISKLRSWETFERMLPPAQTTDAITWQNRLLSAIDQTVAALAAHEEDPTKTTRDAAETLRGMQNQFRWRGELHWHEWVKIAKTNVGAKSRHLLEELKALALSHDEHQQFRDDVRGFTDLVFDIAMDALGEYESYKKKRGLIDYTDMETYVSQLLRDPAVHETLRGELDLLLVDEFQDTSPIQLDIFLQLSRLAKHSIWVGDPKQSIYGFRGAEPALMQAIIRATGGVRDENILKKSWRSRPDLVHAVNAIFTKAFPDLPQEQVALEPAFSNAEFGIRNAELPNAEYGIRNAEFSHPPENETNQSQESLNNHTYPPIPHSVFRIPHSLIHWHFRSEIDEKKVPGQPWLDNCIADQIGILLNRKTPIFNKKRTEVRPVRPGDIAILCRSNRGCLQMAEALHRAGLQAAIARSGLLATTEVRLALACLKYLLTASDVLSAAEIILLTGGMTLEQLVDDRLEWLAFKDGRGPAPAGGRWGDAPYLRDLNALRPRTSDMSASEILNLLLDELDLRRLVVRLGHTDQRLDNLDRLRQYALDYESACNRLHSAASLGGFLLWLDELVRNEKDVQGSGDSDAAVKVMTYHASKGLEFPVTICHGLDQDLKEKVWGINLVSETDEPDLNNILANRWLRYWVNPYSDQLGKTRLEERLHQSQEWMQAKRIGLEEEARLLYVGLTRARDYLVLPTTAKGSKWLNRVFNQGDESIPTLDPYSDETPFYWNGEVIFCENEPLYKPKDFPEALADESPVRYHAPRAGKHPVPRQSLLIDP
ncbi:MAG: UvrD-helicase domain-containing protein, partial [Saprospiraceae bacterium]